MKQPDEVSLLHREERFHSSFTRGTYQRTRPSGALISCCGTSLLGTLISYHGTCLLGTLISYRGTFPLVHSFHTAGPVPLVHFQIPLRGLSRMLAEYLGKVAGVIIPQLEGYLIYLHISCNQKPASLLDLLLVDVMDQSAFLLSGENRAQIAGV